MNRGWKEVTFAVVLAVVIPWLLFSWQDKPQQSAEPEITTFPPQTQDIPVLDLQGNTVMMPLTEYLTGVILCEIPGDFSFEAKMAQAVVARTYALRTVEKGVKHDPAAVCMNSACCQGYKSPQAYLEAGGSPEAVEQAEKAVTATEAEVLTYEGNLIDATYFSCSGGRTEDAVAVWGSDIPYLRSVESPGEEHAAHYTDTVSFSSQAFQDALGVSLPGSCDSWFGQVSYTRGGGIDTLSIGGVTYRGTTLRQLLGLRSTAFVYTATATSVVITTKGFGHRVGMSQYGADAMAASGKTYREILLHYYPGAVIDKQEELG